MRVRINICLDFNGVHTFQWEPSDSPGAVDVPKSTLDRWTQEREAYTVANLRWKRVGEEIEEHLYKSEQQRNDRRVPAQVAVAAVAAKR